MKKNNHTLYTAAVLTVVIMAMLMFGIENTMVVGVPVLTVMLMVTGGIPYKSWTAVDRLLAVLTLFNVVSCYYSITPISAYSTAGMSVFMLAAYWLQRSIFTSDKYVKTVINGYIFVMSVAMLLGISAFVIYRQAVTDAGFHDTYHFRFLYRPLGYINNVWAEITVGLFGISCMVKRWKLPLMCIAAISVLLTFSRGAYLSAFLFVVTALLFAWQRRFAVQIATALTLAIIVIGIFCKNDMATTIQLNGNTAQRQSTKWRISNTRVAMECIRLRPLLGYGNGSYTLVVDGAAGSEDQNTFTSMAPNMPVKLLLESGIVGTLPYVLLLLCVLSVMWKRRHDTQTCIAGCTLIALMAKDMTQAALLHTPVLLFLAYSILAYMQRGDTRSRCNTKNTTWVCTALLSGWFVVFSLINFTHFLHKKETAAIGNGIKLIEKYKKTKNKGCVQKAVDEFAAALGQHPYDRCIGYLLAYSQMQGGNYREAQHTMETLLKHSPEYGLYQFTEGYILYRQGLKKQSMQLMYIAICNMPRLINTTEMKDIAICDPDFGNVLQTEVLETIRHTNSDTMSPIKKANYGYILHHLGHKAEARRMLQKAVKEMPSLRTPWRLLGDRKKYRLLSKGAFIMNERAIQTYNDEKTDLSSILYESYYPRYDTWYLANLPLK